MSSRTAVRRISAFEDNPRQLIEQLSRLEDSVDKELTSLDDWKLDKFEPAPVSSTTYTAKLGQLVVADTSRAAVLIDLPIASNLNAGRMVGVAKTSAAFALTVRSIGQISDVLPSASTVFLFTSALMPGGTYTWLRTGG